MASRCALAADTPGPMGVTPFMDALGDKVGASDFNSAFVGDEGLGFAGMGCSKSNGSASDSTITPVAGGYPRRTPRQCHNPCADELARHAILNPTHKTDSLAKCAWREFVLSRRVQFLKTKCRQTRGPTSCKYLGLTTAHSPHTQYPRYSTS